MGTALSGRPPLAMAPVEQLGFGALLEDFSVMNNRFTESNWQPSDHMPRSLRLFKLVHFI